MLRAANDDVEEAFAEALKGLGPADLSVLHLAMVQAAALQTAGHGRQADALLLGLLGILRDEPGDTLGEAVSLW